MPIIQLALGVMLTWYAIRNKGKIYENSYIKEGKEDYYKKTLRLIMAITGPLLLIHGVLETAGIIQANTILSWVLWGLGFVGIMYMLIFTLTLTDKQKQKEDKIAGRVPLDTQYQKTMQAAFFLTKMRRRPAIRPRKTATTRMMRISYNRIFQESRL